MVRRAFSSAVATIGVGCVTGITTVADAQTSTTVRVDTTTIAAAAALAVRAPEPPKVDGMLDDAAWAAAAPFSDFTQRDPHEGEPGTERTEVRVLYTDDALFVAVRAFDSKADQISAILTRRDEQSPSDWIGVAIDSYYDRRTAFYFSVNAAGVKRDIYFYDDSNEDSSWDAVWDVAVSRDPAGWTAEFRIPFSQLRFSAAERHEFGFNVYRKINRLNEEQYWRVPPKNERGIVSRFGDLQGIADITPPRRVEILPYASTSSDFHDAEPGNPFRDGQNQTARVGADFNIGITSNLTLSATVNPDFGQVEADPAVVNLSAFETFFPEKRPFFLEGLDVFRFSVGGGGSEQLFYSRRVGRRPQGSPDLRGGFAQDVQQSTIIGAAKLTGKTQSGWTIGVLGSLTAEESAAVVDASGARFNDVVEPASGYVVARASKDLRGGLTKIGVISTFMHRDNPAELNFLRSDAYTVGLDWDHRFAGDRWSLNGFVVGSRIEGTPEAIDRAQRSSARYFQRPDNDYVTYDPTRTALSGFTGDLSFGKHAGDWRGRAGIATRSPGFEVNDLGFQRSADWHNQWTWVQRRWLQPGKVFRRFFLNFNQWQTWNYGWERTELGGNINFNFTLKNYWGGYAGGGPNFETLGTSQLRGGPAVIRPGGWDMWGGFSTDSRKDVRGGVDFWYGMQKQGGGWAMEISPDVSFRPASNMDFTISPSLFRQLDSWQYLQRDAFQGEDQYLFGELEQTNLSMTFRGNLTFTPTLSLQIWAQPFVATGDYVGFKRVANPRAATLPERFDELGPDRLIVNDGAVSVDLDRDGSADIALGNPDFQILSFRSNVVLRWEYLLGSTLFVVWQHGRSGFTNDARFNAPRNFGDIFSETEARNTFVVKLNYWFSL